MVVLAVGSRYAETLQVCTEGAGGTEECDPYAVSDLAPLLLAVALLLLPDLSELTIPGLGSLKVRVQQQEQRTELVEQGIARVEQSLNVATAQQQNFTLMLNQAGESLEQKSEELSGSRHDAFEQSEGYDRGGVASAPTSDTVVAQASLQLLDLWTELWPWVQLAERLEQGAPQLRRWFEASPAERASVSIDRADDRRLIARLPQDIGMEDLDAVQEWARLFRDEIRTVRLARNAVAHPPHRLSSEEIEQAFELGERLQRLLHGARRRANGGA